MRRDIYTVLVLTSQDISDNICSALSYCFVHLSIRQSEIYRALLLVLLSLMETMFDRTSKTTERLQSLQPGK